MKVELTNQEINTIIEALEAWETASSSAGFSAELMGTMLVGRIKDPVEEAKFKAEREKRFEEGKIEDRKRKNISIMLKAKFIQAQNRDSEFPVEAQKGAIDQ